ncbi:hypothetical protein N7449_005228 [Penicillium cf. viridicatum]|uniref:Aminoglycoside phosphotransferase domain-containing protein n=1 Tax=Penicillium cf. viridicatum TaxID=2972119 RepID=A0A9W9SYV1_9EURO|nr:hypothetical protein N7449_005228 [Penicillium cf. viridicatum]
MHISSQIATELLSSLESTSYACTELIPLSGGYVNYVYLGKLVAALPTTPPTTQIVIKHAEPYIATHSAWKSPVTRIRYEALMLEAINGRIQTNFDKATTSSPYLYQFFPQINTTALSELPDSIQLQNCLSDQNLNEANVFRIDMSLGQWMRRFHEWGSAPEQASLLRKMKGNTGMAEMKCNITYGRLKDVITMFPAIFEGSIEIFENLAQRVKAEMETEGARSQLIHGDFDCRKWELSQVGSAASNIGQMFAGLYSLAHFQSITAGSAMIASFSAGYGALTDELAFRVISEFGTYLLSWPCRELGDVGDSQVKEILNLGRNMIIHAERQDKAWFRGGVDSQFYRSFLDYSLMIWFGLSMAKRSYQA